ncbi:hypothetical protein B0H14DRAFT_3633656 [Mycena olivaceomarginata]|nr:hypothetical protein B0H14DRAFT_3633656 [Mycena olivaceomarginata]
MPPVRADQVTFSNLVVRPRKRVTRAPERVDHLAAAAAAMRRQYQLAQALRAVPLFPLLRLLRLLQGSLSSLNPGCMSATLIQRAIEDDLQEHFAACGEIEYVNIRYSSSGVSGHPQLGYPLRHRHVYDCRCRQCCGQPHRFEIDGLGLSLVVEPDLLALPERNLTCWAGSLSISLLAVRPDHKLQNSVRYDRD